MKVNSRQGESMMVIPRYGRGGLLAGAAVVAAVAVLLVGAATGVVADAARPRHLICLYGRIVQEQQSVRPAAPAVRIHELERIKNAFRDQGFVVNGEIRPKSASVSDSADLVVEQVRRLLGSGVPADHVTVVGASMGGAIALLASARLQNPDVRFCILGGCLSESVRHLLVDEGKGPSGHVLSIREASDDLGGPCPSWNNDIESRSRSSRVRSCSTQGSVTGSSTGPSRNGWIR